MVFFWVWHAAVKQFLQVLAGTKKIRGKKANKTIEGPE